MTAIRNVSVVKRELKRDGNLKKGVLTEAPHEILKEAEKAGINIQQQESSGLLFHLDKKTIFSKINELYKGKIELLDTKEAFQKYDWLNEYRWKLIDKNKDEFTKKVADQFSGGYFMRIFSNAQVTLPLQSCLMITQDSLQQRVHNIIIAEEGSSSNIITSCVQHSMADTAYHLGVSEIYVKRRAKLNFTMIHNWSEGTIVRPRSAAMIEDAGLFTSNYICTLPVRDIQMYPTAFCYGENSQAVFNSILYGCPNSTLDVGSRAILNGKGSKTDMITRAVAKEDSKIIARGIIEGNHPESKGHLECRGLILDNTAYIHSIPEIIARKRGTVITHEAAIGKISDKEISYLMTRKLTHDQAVTMIIRGFMDVGFMNLPTPVNMEVNHIIDLVAK